MHFKDRVCQYLAFESHTLDTLVTLNTLDTLNILDALDTLDTLDTLETSHQFRHKSWKWLCLPDTFKIFKKYNFKPIMIVIFRLKTCIWMCFSRHFQDFQKMCCQNVIKYDSYLQSKNCIHDTFTIFKKYIFQIWSLMKVIFRVNQ